MCRPVIAFAGVTEENHGNGCQVVRCAKPGFELVTVFQSVELCPRVPKIVSFMWQHCLFYWKFLFSNFQQLIKMLVPNDLS